MLIDFLLQYLSCFAQSIPFAPPHSEPVHACARRSTVNPLLILGSSAECAGKAALPDGDQVGLARHRGGSLDKRLQNAADAVSGFLGTGGA